MGKVVAINISEKKGMVKRPVEQAMLIESMGIEHDAHAGTDHRQISFLANESVNKMRATGIALNFGDFAENITTEGMELHTLPIGTKLKIRGTIHEVSQIGKECHTGCAIKQQVGYCIMPKEGIFTKVLKGGLIKTGDEIVILDDDFVIE